MLGRRDKAKGLEAEVQSLEVRRTGVMNRLTDATTRHEAAIAEQRRFLVDTDGADARQSKAVAEACRKAADDRAALEDAARTLAGLIEDAKARLAAERDRRERDRTAGEIEAGAAAIEAAAAELDRAATAFDTARERLVAVCRTSAPHDPVLGYGPDGGIITAAGRLAGILSRENPMAYMGNVHHIGAVPAAAGTVAAMRENARAIRQGSAPSVLPQKPLAIPAPIAYPMVRVCLAQPAYYKGAWGHRIDLFPGNIELPEPAAQTAIAKGIGFTPSSAAGQTITRALRIEPNASFETDGNGSVRVVKFSGALGEGGKGLPPAAPPVDLGTMPDTLAALPEAAQ
ncbi:hypothetical protein GOFOIKOB_1863 [Methylobacterium tardum]|uniref:Uncharacterized protein n=1 Tax=Methylobacterium tardum TaxID=374432 RepID=A0AA37TI24_9HYPH|nr:hypothetical protein [Methylobacterium tardum]URD39296.1 hypothetical protein M6G65_13325 [Methylobacterium tardum]GJE48829.1 hypothetical protein GOFOIKOB_1863 [Methylobacterium tardum]GLS73970.1 hypothetical protein GCM10007890_59850 [Methylobacterium tardum]